LHQEEINFITLGVFAIGILLIAFGTLTIFISLKTKASDEILFYYSIIKVFLWLGRVILEISFPVKITLFFIHQPTMVVMPLLIVEWLLFVFAAVLISIHRKNG